MLESVRGANGQGEHRLGPSGRDGLHWPAGLAEQPCPTTGIPCECGGGRNIRSRGEAHRPMRVSWHRGAGEADTRADAVGAEGAQRGQMPLMKRLSISMPPDLTMMVEEALAL